MTAWPYFSIIATIRHGAQNEPAGLKIVARFPAGAKPVTGGGATRDLSRFPLATNSFALI